MAAGSNPASSVLDVIVARKREALAATAADSGRLQAMARAQAPARDFAGAVVAGPHPALIAECKRRSPVTGLIAEEYDVAAIARAYQDGGASALSVLTHADFDGDVGHLQAARGSVELPLLAKDFVVDAAQLLEARAYGADCVLLIARILDDQSMGELADRAHELGLQVLVEVHDESEVGGVVAAAPDLVGVNHRNLENFDLDPTLFGRIATLLPGDIPMVAESGFRDRDQLTAAAAAGARAVLVGTALMQASDRAAKVRELLGVAPAT